MRVGHFLKVPSCREFPWQKTRVYKLEERGSGTNVTCTVPHGCTTSFLLHPTTYVTSNQSGDIQMNWVLSTNHVGIQGLSLGESCVDMLVHTRSR